MGDEIRHLVHGKQNGRAHHKHLGEAARSMNRLACFFNRIVNHRVDKQMNMLASIIQIIGIIVGIAHKQHGLAGNGVAVHGGEFGKA